MCLRRTETATGVAKAPPILRRGMCPVCNAYSGGTYSLSSNAESLPAPCSTRTMCADSVSDFTPAGLRQRVSFCSSLSCWLIKPLMRARLALYASPIPVKQHWRPQSPADLKQYPCIVSTCGSPSDPETRRCGGFNANECEVQVTARVSVPDPSVHHQLAVKGIGIAMLAQSEVAADLKERRLVRILPEREPEPIELYALHPSRLAASPKVRTILEFLIKHCSESRRQ